MAHRTEEVSRKFAFRNPADAADAMYENVVRGRGGERQKGHPRGVTTYDAERGTVYFTEWRLRRTILSPAKWPGPIFEIPFPSPLSLCTCLSFFLFPLAHTHRRSFSANGINFRPRSTTQ